VRTVFQIVFYSTFAGCFVSYFFYPAVLWVLSRLVPFRYVKKEIEPFISIIIPAYNESRDIGAKIENTLALDYPPAKREILVGTDGASDETARIVGKYAGKGVRLFEFAANRGKTAVQNDLVGESSSDILIFTDAASFLPAGAVRKLVRSFADNRVGCVAGKMRYLQTGRNLTTDSQGLYWRYEVRLRELESKLGRLIGVDGPLYAVRRENYVSLGAQIISDLITPLLVIEQGKRVVLEQEALVDENPTIKAGHEFETRRRIALRGLVGLSAFKGLLNPLKTPLLALQLFFHKILRWFVGLLVLINLVSCVALSSQWFFQAMLVLYFLLFCGAALGYLAEHLGFAFRLFSVPYYFVLVNMAATAAVFDFMRKKQIVSWKPIRTGTR
jgi:cellulose synthase/poly-beta-1,6-N-acetylglucosamine synthase-like glycosyltransferase